MIYVFLTLCVSWGWSWSYKKIKLNHKRKWNKSIKANLWGKIRCESDATGACSHSYSCSKIQSSKIPRSHHPFSRKAPLARNNKNLLWLKPDGEGVWTIYSCTVHRVLWGDKVYKQLKLVLCSTLHWFCVPSSKCRLLTSGVGGGIWTILNMWFNKLPTHPNYLVLFVSLAVAIAPICLCLYVGTVYSLFVQYINKDVFCVIRISKKMTMVNDPQLL